MLVTLDDLRRALRDHRPVTDDAPGADPAAVALVLAQSPAGPATLLIRRAVRPGDPWSGQIALPGGRWEPADADLLATAARETAEETGIALDRAAALAQLSDLRPRTPLLPSVYVRPFVFALPAPPPLTLSAEVQDARWVPLARLREPGVWREAVVSVPRLDRAMPAYLVDDWVVWGMTERILTPFLELLPSLV